jgi:predicted RNA binding protein YcfA (HicA-like mRNA interferase family)
MGSGRLPVISGKRLVQLLQRQGFITERIVGSHHVLMDPTDHSRTVTVPVHGNKDLKPGTLRSIIRQTGFTLEEFSELL